MDGRFPVVDVSPVVQGGRRPAKGAVGELIPIEATAFREGHDILGVHALIHRPDGTLAARLPMHPHPGGVDRWRTEQWRPTVPGDWTFSIEAFHDPLATWQHRAEVKVPAGVDVVLELLEGAALFDRAADHLADDAGGSGLDLGPSASYAAELLRESARVLRDDRRPAAARLAIALAPDIVDLIGRSPVRDHPTVCGPWPVRVERRRALVGAWYEFFPRSEGATLDPPRSGTFATAAERLPAIAEMGFDVVYLPPVHPIGRTNRKGPNNTLTPGPDDPGSPWAIGAAEGGHDAVHPDLGTLADFDAFLARTVELGMEIALDLALQATPDHPWVTAHPHWFTTRGDGSIAYAENPPKKYQDIYPLNFDNDPEGLYAEVERITRFWMDRGVRIFRVDNPHTKPLWVWDRLIGSINATDPDVLFLAEAFTLPPMMRALAEVGFQQSYTYFTWRNAAWELREYLTELAGPAAAHMRPNFFPNTPDILHEYLQHGGPAAFAIRATLAATMSPTYGIYSGFELYEGAPARPGSEEYLDSEKYQYRPRDWRAAAESGTSLALFLGVLNTIRRTHPALQQLRDITFHHSDDEGVIAYSKRDGDDIVLVVCTLDPHSPRETLLRLDMPALGRLWHDHMLVTDLLSEQTWQWGEHVYIRLDPQVSVAHIVHIPAKD